LRFTSRLVGSDRTDGHESIESYSGSCQRGVSPENRNQEIVPIVPRLGSSRIRGYFEEIAHVHLHIRIGTGSGRTDATSVGGPRAGSAILFSSSFSAHFIAFSSSHVSLRSSFARETSRGQLEWFKTDLPEFGLPRTFREARFCETRLCLEQWEKDQSAHVCAARHERRDQHSQVHFLPQTTSGAAAVEGGACKSKPRVMLRRMSSYERFHPLQRMSQTWTLTCAATWLDARGPDRQRNANVHSWRISPAL